MAASLEFLGVSKRFGQQLALDRLTLDLRPGEILGFVGPNGAGKTTAIHLALGFVLPSSGGGRLLGLPFGHAEARARVGFVPDAPTFFAGSAQRAMEFAGRLNGVQHAQLRIRAKELLARLDLKANGKDARQFSRGMQQRLGLAQALVNDPDLLILDEPTSALDPPGVLEVRELLREARNAGKSVFFSSHQLTEVELICDRIAFLRKGQLLRLGSVHELTSSSDQVEVVVRGLPADSPLQFRHGTKSQLSAGFSRLVIPSTEQREVMEAAWTSGAELIRVNRVRRSLEELFVEWSQTGTDVAPENPARPAP